MQTKKTSYKTTMLVLFMSITFLLFGSLYSIFFVYKVDDQLLDTLKVNNKENDIHNSLHAEVSVIYNNVQHIVEAKNSAEDKVRLSLINKATSRIKENREVCIHNGKIIEVNNHHHSFEDQGKQIIRFFKLKEKAIGYKLAGENKKSKAANEELKSVALTLINQTLKNGALIVSEENKQKLSHLSDNNIKKLKLGVLICFLFFIIGSCFLYLFLNKYKKHNETLEKMALRDNLTNLYNRSSFISAVKKHSLNAHNKNFMVVFFDIDNFKSINTKYGHHIGNEVLINFTERLSSFFVNMDVVFARFGGDEFVLLVKNIGNKQSHKLLSYLSRHCNYYFMSGTIKLKLSASMGSSHYPIDGADVDVLLKKADEAMYFAKRQGKNTFKEYEEKMDEVRHYEARISKQLQTSVSNNDDSLTLLYQPIMNTQQDNEIQECEVLLRWKDKEEKAIPAQEFIRIAEKNSLIDDINLYVIDKVCLQQKEWMQESRKKKEIRVSINISGEAETVMKLLNRLLFNIDKNNLSPQLFGIEVTERVLFDMSDPILKKLTSLRDIGMKISLDDFGIGYSSLFYLRKVPLTTVKIDKAFIDEISFNRFDNTIVKSVIDLSHSLGFTVVAEGVEHQDQLNVLKKYCCDYIQGYLYSKPISNKAMLSMVC